MEPAKLRIGHAERDAVIATLREAAGDGRIEIDELEERVTQALQAKTFADLDPLVADLLVEAPSLGLARPGPPARTPDSVAPPGMNAEDPLRLDAGWSTVRREGSWDMPPFIRVDSAVGTVVLNCLQARPLAEVINIESTPGGGTIKIIVPEGWAANLDRLSTSWGDVNSRIPTSPAPGMPLLLLHGGIGMSNLVIRNPQWFDRKA